MEKVISQKRKSWVRWVGVMVFAWVGVACEKQSPPEASKPGAVRRVGVLRPEAGDFGRLVQAGAEAMGKELGMEVRVFTLPPSGAAPDRGALMRGQEGSTMGAWVVVASNEREPGAEVAKMTKRGIPVVLVDYSGKGEAPRDFLASIGTNEVLAGRRGAEEVVKLVGGAGRVFLSRGAAGASPAKEREAGFLELMRRQLGIQVSGEKNPGADSVESMEVKSMQAHRDLFEANAVFCATAVATEGALRALRTLGWSGQRNLVGFESRPEALEALRKKEIRALVVPNPRRMGQEAVRLIGAHWNGQPVAPRVDVGVELLTPQNVDSPSALQWRRVAD